MGDAGAFALGVVGGIVGALVTDFLRGPFRQFFTRRTEVRHHLLMIGNIGVPDPSWTVPSYTEQQIEQRMRPFLAAQHTLRDLAMWMRAFAETEPLAAWCVKRFGYNPLEASLGLVGLSNTLTQYGTERAAHRERVNHALKLSD
jgi:hypothetical protein